MQRGMIVLLIRSQSGNSLLNLNVVTGIGLNEGLGGFLLVAVANEKEYKIAKYSSSGKAHKVLDELEILYVEVPENSVYYMPADDEVEV